MFSIFYFSARFCSPARKSERNLVNLVNFFSSLFFLLAGERDLVDLVDFFSSLFFLLASERDLVDLVDFSARICERIAGYCFFAVIVLLLVVV